MTDMWITHLMESPDGSLWIGTSQAGLIRWRNGAVRQYASRDGFPSNTVQCLFAGSHGEVWACTPNGLVELNGDTVRAFGRADGLPVPDIRAACSTRDGTILAGSTIARVAARHGNGFCHRRRHGAATDSATVQTMLCVATDDVLDRCGSGGSSEGLFHFVGDRRERLTVADGLADNSVLTLTQDSDGDILAGTTNGFSRVRGASVESFRPQDGLSQSTVYSLYEDREGSLWVATKHGLNQFLDGLTIPYTTSEGLPSNKTGPVLQDRAGTVWVGTLGGGLGRFDGQRFTTRSRRETASRRTSFMPSRKIATATYGSARPPDSIGCTPAASSRRGRSRVVCQATSSGPSIATAPARSGLRPPAARRCSATATSSGLRIRDVARPIMPFSGSESDRDGRLQMAPDADSPSLRHADALYQDSKGLLWIGTVGDGLKLVDDGRVFSFSELDGLFDDVIYGITADDDGRLWMACSKGIFSVDREDLRRFAAGTNHRIVSTPYSPLDALRTIECQPGVQPAVSRTHDGRLWFSTIRGLLVIDPRHLARPLMPPAVTIEDTTVNGEHLAAGPIRIVPAGRNNVEFSYTGVSFVIPSRITFRYLLEGFDKTWVDAGTRRQAFYTNLPPGSFRFRVSACNPDSACSETANAVAFRIEPRYYQRAWFLPACVVGLLCAGWTGYRLRIRRLRTKFDLILAERSRIARELHDTLIQGFAGITMAMQALASRLPSASSVRDTLEEIVGDAGQSLREARRSLAGLRSRPDPRSGLAATVAQTARHLTEPRDVSLNLRVSDGDTALPADVEYNASCGSRTRRC